tara:strand:+ start:4615 stop:5829 length:1215 start_codon:yes stop_codon:yes gene_type:complete
MSPEDIQKAFGARSHAVSELQRLVEESEGQEFSGEQRAEYERISEDIDALDSKIQGGLSHLEREAKANTALENFRAMGDLTAPAQVEVSQERTDSELFRALLDGDIRTFTSEGERRDLTLGSAGAGGNLVTSTLYDRVIAKLEEEGAALAAGATLLNTASGEDMLIPTVTSHTTGALVAEGGTIGESDPAFGQSTLSTYKFGAIVDVSSELAADNGVGSFNVVNFVGDQGGAAVGRALSAEWTSGSGSSRPQGFDNATVGVTAASTSAITTDELIDVYHSITAPYRRDAAWVANDSTLKAVRKLKDGNNQYMWQPGLTVGAPDMLLGRPVHADTNMPEIGAAAVVATFGDFSKGYFARIAGGVRVEQTVADKWATDLVSVRFIVRGGGVIVDTNALRTLKMAAS